MNKMMSKAELEKIRDELLKCRVKIREVSKKQLFEDMIYAKKEWHFNCGNYDFNVYGVDEQTFQRWEVDYTIYNLTEYDIHFKKLSDKYGKKLAYALLRNTVLNEIAKVYTHLAEECQSQKRSYLPKLTG